MSTPDSFAEEYAAGAQAVREEAELDQEREALRRRFSFGSQPSSEMPHHEHLCDRCGELFVHPVWSCAAHLELGAGLRICPMCWPGRAA